MAANVVTTLAALEHLAAEKKDFGGPDWTLLSTGTNSANAAVIAAITSGTNQPAVQHFFDYITLSFSAAPSIGTLLVKDGTTVIWQCELSVSQFFYHFDFSKRPLRNTAGASMTASIAAAGSGIVQTLCVVGHSTIGVTTFS